MLESDRYAADLLAAVEAAASCVALGHYAKLVSTAAAADLVGVSRGVFLRLARDVHGLLPAAKEREEVLAGVVVVRLLWDRADIDHVRASDAAAAARRRRRSMP